MSILKDMHLSEWDLEAKKYEQEARQALDKLNELVLSRGDMTAEEKVFILSVIQDLSSHVLFR